MSLGDNQGTKVRQFIALRNDMSAKQGMNPNSHNVYGIVDAFRTHRRAKVKYRMTEQISGFNVRV